MPPEPPDPATLRFSEVEAMGYRAGFEEGEAQRDRLRAALVRRTHIRDRRPAHRGKYVVHGLLGDEDDQFFEDEMHDPGAPCDICEALAATGAALSDPTPDPDEDDGSIPMPPDFDDYDDD